MSKERGEEEEVEEGGLGLGSIGERSGFIKLSGNNNKNNKCLFQRNDNPQIIGICTHTPENLVTSDGFEPFSKCLSGEWSAIIGDEDVCDSLPCEKILQGELPFLKILSEIYCNCP